MLARVARVLWVVNVVLALAFGAGSVVLVVAPQTVERQVRDEVVRRIASDAVSRYPALATAPWLKVLATGLRDEVTREESYRADRHASVVRFAADWLRILCKYDCGEVTIGGQPAKNLLAERLLEPFMKADKLLPRIEQWARASYEAMLKELLADVKVVAFSNALLFFLAALATRRSTASRISLVLSAILCASALIATWLYVYEQNWLQTLLFSDYVGVGYLIWVALIAGAFSDLVFNRGRLLVGILGEVPGAVISGFG